MTPDTLAQLDRAEDPAVTTRKKKVAAEAQAQQAADTATVIQNAGDKVYTPEAERAAMLKAGIGPEVEAAAVAPVTDRVYHPEADRAAMLKDEQGVLPLPVPATEAPAAVPTPMSAPSPAISGPGPQIAPAPKAGVAGEVPAGVVPDRAAKTPPDWLEKIKTISKKTGKGLLDILQAGAYGYAGLDKQTRLEAATEAEAKAKEQAQQRAWQESMLKVEQQTADRRQQIEQEFQTRLSEARNRWDVDSAEKQMQFLTDQNKMDRDNSLKIAQERFVQQAKANGNTPEQALAKFQESLATKYDWGK